MCIRDSICAVFAGTDQAGYRYAMGSQTVDLRAKAKALHQALGGKGGGDVYKRPCPKPRRSWR